MRKMSEMWKNVLYLTSILVLTEFIFKIKKYFEKRREESEKKSSKELSMGLFFPDFSLCCPFVYRDDYHLKPISYIAPERQCRHRDCKFVHFSSDIRQDSSFRKLCRLLKSAKESVDICLWVFSLEFLAQICVYLKKNNVLIRIVIDSREDETERTQISYLRSNGIAVRFAPQMVNSGMFHHKFAIIDKSILLFGSMNWTLSAVRKNMENVCVTTRPQLVSPYVQRFQYYWDTFSAEPTNKRRLLYNNQNSNDN